VVWKTQKQLWIIDTKIHKRKILDRYSAYKAQTPTAPNKISAHIFARAVYFREAPLAAFDGPDGAGDVDVESGPRPSAGNRSGRMDRRLREGRSCSTGNLRRADWDSNDNGR